MVNLLFQIARQIQLGDQASIQALINIITGIVAAVGCVLYIYRWRLEVMRVALAGFMLFLSVWGAIAYSIILWVDATVNVGLLRWTLSGWHIAAVGVLLIMHMIQTYDPEELCQQRIEGLKHEARNRDQEINNLRYSNKNYIGQLRDMQAEKEKMTADTTTIRKSLEETRAELGRKAVELIEADEEALNQEGEINALKQQIVIMELELKRVRGRGDG